MSYSKYYILPVEKMGRSLHSPLKIFEKEEPQTKKAV